MTISSDTVCQKKENCILGYCLDCPKQFLRITKTTPGRTALKAALNNNWQCSKFPRKWNKQCRQVKLPISPPRLAKASSDGKSKHRFYKKVTEIETLLRENFARWNYWGKAGARCKSSFQVILKQESVPCSGMWSCFKGYPHKSTQRFGKSNSCLASRSSLTPTPSLLPSFVSFRGCSEKL